MCGLFRKGLNPARLISPLGDSWRKLRTIEKHSGNCRHACRPWIGMLLHIIRPHGYSESSAGPRRQVSIWPRYAKLTTLHARVSWTNLARELNRILDDLV